MTVPSPPELPGPLNEVAGRRIEDVRYLLPSGTRWSGDRVHGRMHELDQGVDLVLSGGMTLAVQWEMQGDNEFLSVATTGLASSVRSDLIDRVQVADTSEWAPLIGRRITGAGVSWHYPGDGNPRFPWAIRLELDDRSSFVLALGEIRDDAPAYLPDSVLVLFAKEDAENYRVAGSRSSAWGEDVLA